MNKSLRILLLGIVLLSACTYPLKINQETADKLSQGQIPIHLARTLPTPFEIRIIAHHLIIMGGIEDEEGIFDLTGDKWVQKYDLVDPAAHVQQIVNRDLPLKLPNAIIYTHETPLTNTNLDYLNRQFIKGLVLEFQTTEWELAQLPFSLRNVGLSYSADARLIQLGEDPQVLGNSHCRIRLKGRWTLKQLQANNGELLKEKLNTVAQRCAHDFLKAFKTS